MALVLHWPMTDGSGTTVTDVVGGNHGTIQNAVPNTTWITDSPLGGALRLNGLIGGEATAPFVRSTSTRTMAASGWAVAARFRTTNSSGAAIAGLRFAATTGWLINYLYMGGNGRPYGGIYRGSYQELWGKEYVNDGQWHHGVLQCVNGGSGFELWVDGSLVYEVANSSPEPFSGYFCAGGVETYPSHDGSFRDGRAFDGDICDVRLYDAPLSAGEISALAGTPPATSPVPWYIPPGVLAGKGRVNFVNVNIQTFWIGSGVRIFYPGGYATPYPNLSVYAVDPILQYCSVRNQTMENNAAFGIFSVLHWGNTGGEVGNEGWGRCPNFILANNIGYPLLQNNAFVGAAFYVNRRDPEDCILSASYGQNFSAWGTSQYPAGFAPVPSLNAVPVSPGVNTLNAAVAASQHGDNLVLAPGTYYLDADSGTLVIDKAIRIYGATENAGDVLLTWTDASYPNIANRKIAFYPYRMINVPENSRAPGLFHVTVRQTSTPYGSAVPDAGYNAPIMIVKSDYDEDFNFWDAPLAVAMIEGPDIWSSDGSVVTRRIVGNCPFPSTSRACSPSSEASRCAVTSTARLISGNR
jgi:hypothetical protein